MKDFEKLQKTYSLNITTKNFKWLYYEFWETSEKYFITQQYKKISLSQIFAIPHYSSNKKYHTDYTTIGYWTLSLQSNPTTPLAFCQIQIYKKAFSTLFLFLHSLQPNENTKYLIIKDAISLFISAMFIIYQCDILNLIPADKTIEYHILKLDWSTHLKTFYTWAKNLEFIPNTTTLKPIKIIELDKHNWWNYENAKSNLISLKYLMKRFKTTVQDPNLCTNTNQKNLNSIFHKNKA